MKLTLRHEEGISILEVSGAVDLANFQVLKAGISKLMRDGKNKIVLRVVDAEQIPAEVMRELAIVDLFARELSGQIVLASDNEKLKESVRTFAKPPVIPILSTVALCLDYFRNHGEGEEVEESVADLKKALAAKDLEIKALQAQVKKLDPKEINGLRADKAELQGKLKLLEAQVAELIKGQRDPGDVAGFMEKISFLEDSVKKLSAGTAAK